MILHLSEPQFLNSQVGINMPVSQNAAIQWEECAFNVPSAKLGMQCKANTY